MPAGIRKDDKAKRIALEILGPPAGGLTDSFGKEKKFKNKKKKQKEDGESINRFEEIGFR